MALSFHDELYAFLVHGIEQDPLMHAVTTGATVEASDHEMVGLLTRLAARDRAAMLKIAAEIDDLRAATDTR